MTNLTKPLTADRRDLLRRLEFIIGNSFYNPSIRNHGPGGSRLPDGRSYRYPLTLLTADGEKEKITHTIAPETSDEAMRTGYYAVGANQLQVIAGLEEVLKYLEEHAGLKIS